MMMMCNLGAQQLAKNAVFHGRCKHIDIKHQHVKEMVKLNQIDLKYISTDEINA